LPVSVPLPPLPGMGTGKGHMYWRAGLAKWHLPYLLAGGGGG
jgi:hypothetical protein